MLNPIFFIVLEMGKRYLLIRYTICFISHIYEQHDMNMFEFWDIGDWQAKFLFAGRA